jgi:hypothetical protein
MRNQNEAKCESFVTLETNSSFTFSQKHRRVKEECAKYRVWQKIKTEGKMRRKKPAMKDGQKERNERKDEWRKQRKIRKLRKGERT